MSSKLMGMVWELDIPANKSQVLLAMVDHADHEGKNIYPRLGFIAWKTGYSIASIKRIVADLRDDGILVPDGHTMGGVVKYRAEFGHVKRKPPFVEVEQGRPEGSGDFEPRGPYGKRGDSKINPSQNDTGLFDTHNHHSVFSNSKNSEVVVTATYLDEVAEKENLSTITDSEDVLTTRLTLADVTAFDSNPSGAGVQLRYLCPLCGHNKSRTEAHQSLALNTQTQVFYCHRCGVKGRLGSDANFTSQRQGVSVAPKNDWRETWKRSNPMPLLGTLGERYLRFRGIDAQRAAQSGVVFAGSLYNRAAVCFPIRGDKDVLVAMQGRHIDRSEPRMHTIGPKKLGVFATQGAWTSDVLAVTEAPIDALSFAQMFEIPAIALCGSGLIPEWVFKRVKGELILGADNDEAGNNAAADWERQCGRRIITRRVIPNSKDWNGDLVQDDLVG